MSSSHSEALLRDGFVVLRACVAPTAEVVAAAARASQRAGCIFNGEHRNDRRRVQTLITRPPGPIAELMQGILQGVALHTGVVPDSSEWYVLLSKAGCGEQAAHTDFTPDADLKRAAAGEAGTRLPHFAVAALQDDTRLVVWKGSHLVVSGLQPDVAVTRCDLTLNVGDVVLVRADTVHAGAAYDDPNVRLHAFLDTWSVPRAPNRTWLLHRHADEATRTRVLGQTEVVSDLSNA